MNQYNRIADIITHLDQRHVEQPDLSGLAQLSGMSPFHLHRLFTRWAAVTPKDFLQCLTVAHAKKLLMEGAPVLDAALEAGLSGPGRLHDLCVTLEAASPGELKSGGEGWTLTAGFAETPFGRGLIAESPRGFCHISFGDKPDSAEWAELQNRWPRARLERRDSRAQAWVKKIFQQPNEPHPAPPLRAYLRGTPFQIQVWRALMTIPPGRVTSYGRLASAIRHPAASRAVGTAVGQNWLGYLIPCHRVIRETGVIGEYRWGTTRKRAMLAWENRSPH